MYPGKARCGPAQKSPEGPVRAQGRPTRAWPISAQGAYQGPAHEGPGGPIRSHPLEHRGAHKGPAHNTTGGP